MDKNTLTGLVLIGAILLGFTLYNENHMEQQRAVQAKIDSINNVAKEKERKLYELSEKDSINSPVVITQNYLTAQMNSASVGTEKVYTLENDLITAKISNKGAAIKSVELKNYKTYLNEPLYLFKEKDSKFNLSFFTNRQNNTSDFYFTNKGGDVTVVEEGDSKSMIFTLPLSETGSIEYIYTLAAGSNVVDFNIKFNNVDNILSAAQSNLHITWANKAPQQEKGYSYENRYTTIGYMSPNASSIDELSYAEGSENEEIESKVKWIAFKQQFFSSIFIAKDSFDSAVVGYSTEARNSGFIKDFNTTVALPFTSATKGYDFSFYFGPNQYNELKALDLNVDKLIPLGWGIFGWVNKFLVIPTFNFLGGFISNYGLIIFLLTIFIKVLLFFFTYKSYISMANMRLLKPEIDALNAKYPDKADALKKQQATMELYRKAGVNPAGGCLPMLLQMPILIAMFQFFPSSIELRGESFLWASDLSSYDSILNLPFDIPFYGDHVSLFALLMGASLIFSTKMNSMNNNSSAQLPGMNVMMTWVMPLMMIVWFNSYSSGLCYYYFLANLITIIQTFVMRRFVSDEKLHSRMKENAKKPKKTSKWAAKYSEMVKQQEQMRQQQNKK